MSKKVEFKIHEPPDSHTKDLTLRVSYVANGFVIKAGGAPYICADKDELKAKLAEVVEEFASRAMTVAPAPAPVSAPRTRRA